MRPAAPSSDSLNAGLTLSISRAAFDFLPNIIDPPGAADVAASFDASAGWGLNDTELDLVSMFNLGDPGSSSRTAQPPHSGYDTPSVDWLRLLGNIRDPTTTTAPPPAPAHAAEPFEQPSFAQAPPPATVRPPREPLAGVSPHATLSAADSLATPSDGGGPEAPTATPWVRLSSSTRPFPWSPEARKLLMPNRLARSRTSTSPSRPSARSRSRPSPTLLRH